MRTEIIKLAKEKMFGHFYVIGIEETGEECGAYYGSMIIAKHPKHYTDGFIFRTGYIMLLPNILSLTDYIPEIENRYYKSLNKFYGEKDENNS